MKLGQWAIVVTLVAGCGQSGDGGSRSADGGAPSADGAGPTPDGGNPTRDGGTGAVVGCGHTYPAPTLPCASPGACGFPDATNTGVDPKLTLTPMTTSAPYIVEIRTDNTVIDGVHLTGSFDVYANNVTIQNSSIESRSWWGINLRQGYTGLKVLHCTIHGTPGQGADYNGGNDYGISDQGEGITEVAYNEIEHYGAPLSAGSGCFHDNYTHNEDSFQVWSASNGWYWVHTDPFISDGGNTKPLYIENNTFINDDPNGASASIGLFNDTGAISNVTVHHNWMAGGSYCLYPGSGGTVTNERVTDNLFSTQLHQSCGLYGAVAGTYWSTDPSNVWNNNAWADGSQAGQPVPPM